MARAAAAAEAAALTAAAQMADAQDAVEPELALAAVGS
jgi:hypothetical protein